MTDILHRLLLVLLLVAALSACQGERGDEPDPVPPAVDETPRVGFFLVVDGATDPGSRATPAGDYHPGFDYEKYINFADNDIRFYFFSAENKFLGEFKPDGIAASPADSTNHSKRYWVIGDLPFDFSNNAKHNVKLMVLANWRTRTGNDYPVLEEGNEMSKVWTSENGIFEYNPHTDSIPSPTNPIPFYGVTNAIELSRQSFNINNNFTTSFGTIHLLRALAKVEVILSEESIGRKTKIKDMWFTYYNRQGYCAPNNVDEQRDYVHGNYDSDYTSTPHIVANTSVEGRAYLTPVNDDSTRFVTYVPEYLNTINGSKRREHDARILVRFEGSKTVWSVSFAKYMEDPDKAGHHIPDPDRHFDILRNNWYKFTLNKRETYFDVQVVVAPYAGVELDPEFGLDYDEKTNTTDPQDPGN